MLRKRDIIMAYQNPLVRTYCLIRFLIIRINILEKIQAQMAHFPNGDVLDIGCGFGLFTLYNASRNPGLQFYGFDLNARRIQMAQSAARRLGLTNVTFKMADARREVPFQRRYKAIYMLDLLHHIPVLAKYRLLKSCHQLIDDDGIVIIKDINTRPWYKTLFTWLLDLIMAPQDRVTYQSHKRIAHILRYCGFTYRREFIKDFLPYPHLMMICSKAK